MDSTKLFHRLVSIDEAIKLVGERVELRPLGVEEVEVENALYRVLAVDIYAPIDYPPFDRSEVDGYAVKTQDVEYATELNPVSLRVTGVLRPGESGHGLSCENGVVRISTGAIIPSLCDAVVMEEYTERENSIVKIYRPVAPGENVSTCGSDISSGDFILPRGTLLKHQHIALLAGLGIQKIQVYKQPRVAVFSTGVEVVRPGEKLELGKVYDANGFLITSFLRELGALAEYKGVLPDDYTIVKESIERALRDYDMVFTSGGTSAGETDLVYRVFQDLGEIIIHGLKTKPGKPTVIAVSQGKLLVGLPGFPLSCYMILTRIVKPIISRITGYKYISEKLEVRIPFKIRKHVGKTWLIPSILVESRKGFVAYPVSLSSGSLYSITYSDGFVELPEELDVVDETTPLYFYPFSEAYRTRRLTIIGSNDPLLENLLVKSELIYTTRILNTGSLGGWLAVSRGEADIAPTHLLDEETGLYNTPLLDKYKLRDRAVLIRGYKRLIGFIVKPGNPKGIKSFEDFLREDIKIVNRPRGSGIRTLIDINLSKIARKRGLDPSKLHLYVKGYTYEVKTHTAVGYAVKTGKADVGIAVGYVAELYQLDFIPITWEEYDFLIPNDRLDKREVRVFLENLRELRLEDFRFNKYYEIPMGIGTEKTP